MNTSHLILSTSLILIFDITATSGLKTRSQRELFKKREVSIVNGFRSPMREFFVQVSVLRFPKGAHLCGGTIVGVNIIATAAHCVFGRKVSEVRVHFGDYTNNFLRTVVPVVRWVIAPNFVMKNANGVPENDLAFVRLSYRVPRYMILPMCKSYGEFGSLLGSCGMGFNSSDEVAFPKILQEFHLRESFFLNWDLFQLRNCPAEVICTYPVTPDASLCLFDFGGPLYKYRCGTTEPECLYGIASYSVDSDKKNVNECNGAGVFTNLYYHRDFISRVLAKGSNLL